MYAKLILIVVLLFGTSKTFATTFNCTVLADALLAGTSERLSLKGVAEIDGQNTSVIETTEGQMTVEAQLYPLARKKYQAKVELRVLDSSGKMLFTQQGMGLVSSEKLGLGDWVMNMIFGRAVEINGVATHDLSVRCGIRE